MKNIIIIDDELDMAQTMAVLLQGEGYKTLGIADGYYGIDRMKLEVPDLVILDVMMPIIKGLDIIRIMKDDPKLSQVPILLISASKEPVKQGSGWDGFLRKPFDIYELVDVVKDLSEKVLVNRYTK